MLRTLKLLQDSLLDRIMDWGTGSVVYLSSMDPEKTAELIRILSGEGRPVPEVWDLLDCCNTPYPPFTSLLTSSGKSHPVFSYHRHRGLFPLTGDDSPQSEPEDLLSDELYFERNILEGALAKAVAQELKSERRLIILKNSQLLPPESLDFLQRPGLWDDFPLALLVVREGEVPGGRGWHRSRDFWIRKDSAGEVIRLPAGETSHEPVQPPPAQPREMDMLSRWLCFEHCLMAGEARLAGPLSSPERSGILFLMADAQASQERWDQSIPLLEEVLEGEFPGRNRAQILLAQSWREKNDRLSALRTIQVLISEAPALSPQDRIRYHMLCRRMGFSPAEAEHIPNPPEAEILELCRQLGWENHRAFILTQNNAVETAWPEEERRRIQSQLEEGVGLCRKLGNRRRLASGLHALGHLMMKSGDFTGAAGVYRKALAGYRKYTPPMVLARMLNGFGYLHFTIGQYPVSLRMHTQALKLLEGSRYYEELLTTMVNLSRVYHFSGQGQPAVELLSSVFQLMGNLPGLTLPFLSTQTLLANLGLSALDARRYSQAVEISRRLEDHFRKNPSRETTEYSRLFFTRRATLKEDPEEARHLFQETEAWLIQKMSSQIHLRMYLLTHWAEWESRKNPAAARELALRGLGLSREPSHFPREKARLQGLLSSLAPALPPLPAVSPDYRLVKELMEMDGVLLQLHRKIRDMAFVQRWQQHLVGDLFAPGHPQVLAGLVKDQWGLECARFDVTEETTGIPSPESYSPEGVVIPVKIQDKNFGTFLFKPGPGQTLSLEDFKIFQLAVGSLNLVLVAQEKNRLLEDQKQKLEASNLDLEITLGNLKAAQNQLVESEKLAALGGLVAGVAHEINTPLGVALTGVTYLKERAARLATLMNSGNLKKSDLQDSLETLQESSDMVTSNLERAALLIQSFKQVAVDQSTEFRRKFNLKIYMGEILKSLSPKWKHTGVKVTVQGQNDVEMDSYPGAIAQIVTNLISNSLLHGFPEGEEGEITIGVNRTPSGEAILIHQDNGRGIPAENLGKIFHPFFTTSRGRGGTGLGLHIVYNLITQKLGGRIRVESAPGSGTTFYITMPMVQPGL